MVEIEGRRAILKQYTTKANINEELCQYTANKFLEPKHGFDIANLSIEDEAHILEWEQYCDESKETGVFETLKKYLIQFQFPISKGISESTAYRGATLKGLETIGMSSAIGLQLNEPKTLELWIHNSIAGKIPILLIANDKDFTSVIQALTYKNEPAFIPQSTGAAMINGLNNWGRIRSLKKEWLDANPLGDWRNEFAQNVVPKKSLYQDKLIVLSKKPYSGVNASCFGLSKEEWIRKSIGIRLEHECAHFFTLKVFGSMANNMHDELIADYMGITKVLGKFNSNWFLNFIGLEKYPEYRGGARLQNYLNEPSISYDAVVILRSLLKKAAANLELFDEALRVSVSPSNRVKRLLSICSLDILELSQKDACEKLMIRYDALGQTTKFKTSIKI